MGLLIEYAGENELPTLSSTDLGNGYFSAGILVHVDSIMVERNGTGDYRISFMPHFVNMNPDGHDERVADAKFGITELVRQFCSSKAAPNDHAPEQSSDG